MTWNIGTLTAVNTKFHPQNDRPQREALLSGVAAAARQLLTIADIDAAVNGALEAIAIATESDRIYICQHHKDPSTQQITVTYLYARTTSESTKHSGSRDRVLVNLDVCGDWLSRVDAGETMQGPQHLFPLVKEMPKPDAAVSRLVVPIPFEENCWGSVWFDDCTTKRVWNASEVAVLETAAACLGSAIERDRTRQERDAAARVHLAELVQINHGLQHSLAERAKANQAISQTLNTLASKPQLSEFLGQLLLAISDPLGACKAHLFLYDEPSHTLSQFVTVQEGQVFRENSPIDPEILKQPVPADITPGWSIIMSSDKPFTFDENSPYDNDIWWPGTFEWHQAQG
ncbi:MAG: hypothetical protein AAFY57_19940, partial [Cyanobacteria bacterium J06642_2]